MFKAQFLLFCYLLIGSNAAIAPFIDKCSWDDKACLISSSQKAVPYFADGLPDWGLPPLDPVSVDSVALDENGLHIDFKDIIVSRTKNCKFTDVERNIQEKWLKLACECPISVDGSYKSSGQLMVIPVEGDGPFHIKSDKISIKMKIDLETVTGNDGEKHWKVGTYEQEYEFIEKATLVFENLYNGDQEKAAPINAILDQNWKELVQSFGKPIVEAVIEKIIHHISTLAEKVPSNELEN